MNIRPHELDLLEFWRIEKLLEKYEQYVKNENEMHHRQEKEQGEQFSNNNFKQPELKIPQMQIPNFNNFKP
jgi:HSP90 family molecular chaperone